MVNNHTPTSYIRSIVLGIKTQEEFAVALETTQATVSRWEKSGRFPSQVQIKVRNLAANKNIPWQDNYFFEVPEGEVA